MLSAVSRLLPCPLALAAILATALCGCPQKPAASPPTAPPEQTKNGEGHKDSAPNHSPAAEDPPAAQNAPALEPSGTSLIKDWPKPAVALVLTGQLLGFIEPCGCSGLENQKGGLARRHTLIRQLADDRGWTVVPLDVGSQVKRFGKQQEVKFSHIVQGLRTMGYRGMTLGEGDLKLSPGELLAAIAGPDGTVKDFISSNVAILARDLQPRSLLIEAGGKKIGVTAVLGAKYEEKLLGDELLHESAVEGLKAAADELKNQSCDFTVLLAHAPLDQARLLAKEIPVFDLVVASGETSLPAQELEKIDGTKTRLMQVGLKGMYVGVVGLFDDPQTPVRYDSVPLDGAFGDSPEMLQLLADYQAALKEMGFDELGAKPQPHPTGRQFAGSAKCGACHTKAFEVWSKSGHAHATDTLVSPPNNRGHIARHFDPECLSCHVTGWNAQQHYPYPSGYLSLEKTPQLTHVGCENCHGPGAAHVAAESGAGNPSESEVAKLRDALKLPLAGGAAESKCTECHDLDNSPDFHKDGAFEVYWKKVEHVGKE